MPKQNIGLLLVGGNFEQFTVMKYLLIICIYKISKHKSSFKASALCVKTIFKTNLCGKEDNCTWRESFGVIMIEVSL